MALNFLFIFFYFLRCLAVSSPANTIAVHLQQNKMSNYGSITETHQVLLVIKLQ